MSSTPSRTGRPWSRVKARVIRRDGGVCHLCGLPGADTADHLTPVAHGGAVYSMANLAAAHIGCNKIRGTRTVDEARSLLASHYETSVTERSDDSLRSVTDQTLRTVTTTAWRW